MTCSSAAANAPPFATLVERKTRHTLLVPIRGGHTAQNVGDALITVFTHLPRPLRRTLTWDQGNEMFHHERIEQASGTRIYFADPHSPWQRGSNENTNGLLRQYFPKGTDFCSQRRAHTRSHRGGGWWGVVGRFVNPGRRLA